MGTDYLAPARALAPELNELRRTIHRHPELGNQEYRTAALVEKTLQRCGLTTRRLLDTAVVGVLRGGLPGPCAALRADMDALPVREETGAAFASEIPGVMHACGHDVHTAAALGAAKLLAARRDTLPGSVVFLFQPDEEGSGGAARMIREGCLEGVDAVFGAHVSPDLPAGRAGFRYGKFYAASDMFTVTLKGRSAHGAERERGIDALEAAAALVTALLKLPDSFPGERSVVHVGTLRAGTAGNVVADAAELTGILRTLGQDTRAAMRERFVRTVEDLSARMGVTPEISLRESYPGVVNHDDMTALAEAAARTLLGPENVSRIPAPTMGTEDFGYFLLERPGCFYHIGAGCPLPLHNSGFLPDDDAVVTAAALHAAVIDLFLRGGPEGSGKT